MLELISDYMRDERSRHLLNELTQKTFGFDFEGWVTDGYFEGDYIPYSFVEDGVMISNVSANRMKFEHNGTIKNYIQIGTVMTDVDYRKQGLALEFYKKMGFSVENQYRYYLKDEFLNIEKAECRFMPIKDQGEALRQKYLDYVRHSARHSSFEQVNKYGLQMFYTSGLDSVYYAEDIDCFIVKEQDDCTVIGSVLSKERIPLIAILRRIDVDNRCRLGFVPFDEDRNLCVSEEYDGGDDYRLFYRGAGLESIERDKLFFPDLSHA